MKVFILFTILFSSMAGAESQIACWNMHAKKGARPTIKADIGKDNNLENIQIDFSGWFFESYKTNTKFKDVERLSELSQPPADGVQPTLNENKRSSYKGNNEYSFVIGRYQYKSRRSKYGGIYEARWILPTNLDRDFLKNYRIRIPEERSNSVVVVPPPAFISQGGDSYLRLFCVSR